VSYKLIILDRDGVINVPDKDKKYIFHRRDFVLYNDVGTFFSIVLKENKKLAIATNQRGIAQNLYTPQDVELLHQDMLSSCGLEPDDVTLFFCPHEANMCNCRKPKPGLLNSALVQLKIEKNEAIFIGDKLSDQQAAKIAGIDFIKLNRDANGSTKSEVRSLLECLPIIMEASHG
jgi:D-glycero-D-manno-heptose 1,7-bisphosphate phosphatase